MTRSLSPVRRGLSRFAWACLAIPAALLLWAALVVYEWSGK